MPINLPNIQANPVAMEAYPIIGAYVQGGHGTEFDFYNSRSTTILPGEPVNVFGRLCFSKDLILPGEFGTLVYDVIMDFLLDPDLAAQILQGDLVYFDLDLVDATLFIPGYATNVEPSNGYLLGHAMAPHEQGPAVVLSAGSAVAATTSQLRVLVKCAEGITTFGTVPNFLSSS